MKLNWWSEFSQSTVLAAHLVGFAIDVGLSWSENCRLQYLKWNFLLHQFTFSVLHSLPLSPYPSSSVSVSFWSSTALPGFSTWPLAKFFFENWKFYSKIFYPTFLYSLSLSVCPSVSGRKRECVCLCVGGLDPEGLWSNNWILFLLSLCVSIALPFASPLNQISFMYLSFPSAYNF